jgi:hypothetical protein
MKVTTSADAVMEIAIVRYWDGVIDGLRRAERMAIRMRLGLAVETALNAEIEAARQSQRERLIP